MITVGPVTFDDELVVLAEFDPDERWNGWLCPAFDAYTVVAVLGHIVSAELGEVAFDWTFAGEDLILTDRRTLAEQGVGYEPAVVAPTPDGLYPLGARAWCWYAPDPGLTHPTSRRTP